MRVNYVLCCAAAMFAFAASGKAAAQDMTVDQLVDALTARTPGAVLDQMRDDPDGFLTQAVGLVLGYGGPDGITPAGIDDAIDAEHARVRAREMRRLLEADLNNDLAVDARELAVLVRAASATMRGRLTMWHRTADLDRNGTVDWAELRNHAQTRATQALTEDAAATMRALMVFDLDGDGHVTVAELDDAIGALAAPV